MYLCRETFEMMPYTPPGDLPVGLPGEILILNSFIIFNPSHIFEIYIEIKDLKKAMCEETQAMLKICVRAHNKLKN